MRRVVLAGTCLNSEMMSWEKNKWKKMMRIERDVETRRRSSITQLNTA